MAEPAGATGGEGQDGPRGEAGASPAARVFERVHHRLRSDILEGRLGAGDAVPSERSLAEEHGVNRHAVREALKRLEQAGLVRISQGGPTRVLDWRDSGGLEVLLDLLAGDGTTPPLELARAILEMRASIGVDAARRCALRADAGVRDQVGRLAEAAAESVGGEPAEAARSYEELWQAIVVGSQNIAYRLALNSLVEAVRAYGDIAAVTRPANRGGIRALGAAIAAGGGHAAARAAALLLERDAQALG